MLDVSAFEEILGKCIRTRIRFLCGSLPLRVEECSALPRVLCAHIFLFLFCFSPPPVVPYSCVYNRGGGIDALFAWLWISWILLGSNAAVDLPVRDPVGILEYDKWRKAFLLSDFVLSWAGAVGAPASSCSDPHLQELCFVLAAFNGY